MFYSLDMTRSVSNSELFWLDVLDNIVRELTIKDQKQYVGIYAPIHSGILAITEDHEGLANFALHLVDLIFLNSEKN